MDISFLDVSLMIYSKWWFIHLVSFFSWHFFVIWFQFLKVLSMHIYFMYFLGHLFFLWPNIGETPPSLKLDEMCMKFIFVSICTFYVEFVLCIVCSLTLWSQWVWVPFCLCCCSRNNWRCIGCSAHSQGRWCHHVLIGVKLGWSMNYFVPSIGIYYILPMVSR